MSPLRLMEFPNPVMKERHITVELAGGVRLVLYVLDPFPQSLSSELSMSLRLSMIVFLLCLPILTLV